MTPFEAELTLVNLLQKNTGNKALAGVLDAGNTLLGFADDAVTPAATKLQNAVVGAVGKIDPKWTAQMRFVLTEEGKY